MGQRKEVQVSYLGGSWGGAGVSLASWGSLGFPEGARGATWGSWCVPVASLPARRRPKGPIFLPPTTLLFILRNFWIVFVSSSRAGRQIGNPQGTNVSGPWPPKLYAKASCR